jgi:hypothetical protein
MTEQNTQAAPDTGGGNKIKRAHKRELTALVIAVGSVCCTCRLNHSRCPCRHRRHFGCSWRFRSEGRGCTYLASNAACGRMGNIRHGCHGRRGLAVRSQCLIEARN